MLDEENAPSHMTISNFIHNELGGRIQDIFDDINSYIFGQLHVDLNHAYIDGTKIEANANKYTWVWKKSCIKSLNTVFGKISALLEDINAYMALYQRAVTMYEKESKDSKYRDNPYRACNFDIDYEGFMVCPNGRRNFGVRSDILRF